MTRSLLASLYLAACSGVPAHEPVAPQTPPAAPALPAPRQPAAAAGPPASAPAALGDVVPLGNPAQVKLGDPVKGPGWCWKEPRTLGIADYRRSFAFVLLQRTMLHVLRTASATDDAFGDMKALREQRLAETLRFYFVTPVRFDASAVAADGIAIVDSPFPAATYAFDQRTDVLQLAIELQGFVTIPGGGEALRIGLERRRLSGVAPYKSSELSVTEYCVVFEPPARLTVYKRLVLHS